MYDEDGCNMSEYRCNCGEYTMNGRTKCNDCAEGDEKQSMEPNLFVVKFRGENKQIIDLFTYYDNQLQLEVVEIVGSKLPPSVMYVERVLEKYQDDEDPYEDPGYDQPYFEYEDEDGKWQLPLEGIITSGDLYYYAVREKKLAEKVKLEDIKC